MDRASRTFPVVTGRTGIAWAAGAPIVARGVGIIAGTELAGGTTAAAEGADGGIFAAAAEFDILAFVELGGGGNITLLKFVTEQVVAGGRAIVLMLLLSSTFAVISDL